MTEKRERFLILIRHAHRDTSWPPTDNGLSDKGHEQLKHLRSYFKKRWEKGELFDFWSSPKKRCIETLEAVASVFGEKVQVEPLLDEQGGGESQKDLQFRVRAFLEKFSKEKNTWVCCTHGDWVPEFMGFLGEGPMTLKKSGVLVLKQTSSGSLRPIELISQWKALAKLTKC